MAKKSVGEFIAEEIRAMHKKKRSRKQAIAIGLSRARKAGNHAPPIDWSLLDEKPRKRKRVRWELVKW